MAACVLYKFSRQWMVTAAHNKCVDWLLGLAEVAARLVDGGSKDVAGEQSSGVSVDIH